MTATAAKRKLHEYGSQGNWRFKGLLLAALDNNVSSDDVAKAWPTHKSDYRFLSDGQKEHDTFGPERRLAVEEKSDEHRMLSDYTKESDWKELGEDRVGITLDRAFKRTLFGASTPEEIDTLWREELKNTVIEGAQRRQIARDVADVMNVDTKRGDHPRGEAGRYARSLAEGGEIRDDREEFDTVQWNCVKHGEGARVTDEMVDHALIDLIEREVSWVGESVENKLNRVFLNTLVDDAANDFDTAGSDQAVPAVNGAITEVEVDDFQPDTAVIHPRYAQTLFDDSNLVFAQQFGSDEAVRDRVFSPLLGIEFARASAGTYNSSSNTWDFAADGDKGAVVYQQDHTGIYMYQDIEVKDYEDPIRDLQGMNARAWFDVVQRQPDAACTIQY